jgi:hypothetical protein
VAASDLKFFCRATLSTGNGQERLATRNFVEAEAAADWALVTAQRLRLALGSDNFDKIGDAIDIQIVGHVQGDPTTQKVTVFAGPLATAAATLSLRAQAFERDELPILYRAVAARIAARKRRKILIVAASLAAGAVAIGLLVLLPPILDAEQRAETFFGAPPAGIAGRWALGNPETNCETNYVEFQPRRYEAVLGPNRQSFDAAYSQPTPETMRIEYGQGGIRLVQTFRLPGENGRMTIANIEANDPAIENTARRAIGTILRKCPPAAPVR